MKGRFVKYILIVDDIQENRYLLDALLKGNGYGTIVAQDGAEALEMARREQPDLVVSDILMPVMDGYDLCREWKRDPSLKEIPFIFYTATYTEPEDCEFALSLGAERFVLKPQEPEKLISIITEVLQQPAGITTRRDDAVDELKTDDEYLREHSKALFRKLEKKMTDVQRLNRDLAVEISERKRLEEKVAETEERFYEILDAAPMAMVFMDMDGGILHVNKAFIRLFGYRLEELPDVDTWLSIAYPDSPIRKSMEQFWEEAPNVEVFKSSNVPQVEARVRCKNGSLKNVSVLEGLINDTHLSMYCDLTEQSALVSQLIQAQKMEAIGYFAGGLTHDFNNVLMTISGYGELLQETLPSEGDSREFVEEIINATGRGKRLARRICSFGRKQEIDEKPVGLDHIVMEAEDMLRRLVRKGIELKTDLLSEDTMIMADINQIEQILMNLVKNASDAIEGEGAIAIGTQKVMAGDEETGIRNAIADRPQILLTVTDTGCGMDDETQKNIFEPFFTSKEKERGTGLGLSVVRHIVKLHRGYITVDSVPEKGTKFSIYFPAL